MMYRLILLFAVLILIFNSCSNSTSESGKKVNPDHVDSLLSDDSTIVTSEEMDIDLSDFKTFWIIFRKAVIINDRAKLIELTQFPLKAHGRLDSDPQFNIQPDEFSFYFKICVNEPVESSENNETIFDFFKNNKEVHPNNQVSIGENTCRVCDLIFEKSEDTWKLTMIYFDTSHYTK